MSASGCFASSSLLLNNSFIQLNNKDFAVQLEAAMAGFTTGDHKVAQRSNSGWHTNQMT